MDELDEINRRVAEAMGYEVSWWSIHPWRDYDEKGRCKPVTFGTEVLLPDDKGDMPGQMMRREGEEWKPVLPWARCLQFAFELVALAEAAGLTWMIYRLPDGRINCAFNEPIEMQGEAYERLTAEAQGEDVKEAVCRAFIAWKGAK